MRHLQRSGAIGAPPAGRAMQQALPPTCQMEDNMKTPLRIGAALLALGILAGCTATGGTSGSGSMSGSGAVTEQNRSRSTPGAGTSTGTSGATSTTSPSGTSSGSGASGSGTAR
ncbi:conserved hypothetical protein [Cupriavidus taiwanensis]|nr:conserved hypothetical protein [Cupriavidus taiwanensis]SOY65301.1 conserved hypothetical protein [Cupriavidus taiwanensis]SOY94135.1 conserved hypothetical protein [Cupriavidus taiwanensis]SOZ27298.1 conserved hypothetical protein [Cupriavidus taiwanensis]SOZ69605.1 conserved hypothetical protein [Cupriavidus taiwanensis]